MTKKFIIAFFVIVFFILVWPVSAQVDPNIRERLQNNGAIIVDHNSLSLFDRIPAVYLERAKNIRLLFSDRSVGDNINNALNCLTASSWWTSSNNCRKDYTSQSGYLWQYRLFNEADYLAGTVPERILFQPDPVKYDRSAWKYEHREGEWMDLTRDFVTSLFPTYVNNTDVLSYQFSYLNIGPGDTIDDPENPSCSANANPVCFGGFFVRKPSVVNRYDISDIEELEQGLPSNKLILYWTTSLSREYGTADGYRFNNQMRDYVRTQKKVLIDFADIISHTDKGQPCYDNCDGVYQCDPNVTTRCEDCPDDGINYPAICQDYTTEVIGGHLGSVSGANIRINKAMWILMAQIAGWNPGSTQPTITPTRSPTPTPRCTPNCTGKVCGDDGCGGSCGSCSINQSCINYQCVAPTSTPTVVPSNSPTPTRTPTPTTQFSPTPTRTPTPTPTTPPGPSPTPAPLSEVWYMAGANPQRTSWISKAPTSLNGIKWYRPIEAFIDPKTQIVTGNRNIYVATTKGLLVLDAENGSLKWRFDTELPIGHSPTVVGQTVYFSCFDGKVYALNDLGNTYQVKWIFSGAKSSISVNPLVVNNRVYFGGRDGYFYALNSDNGALIWQYPAAGQPSLGPILISAAYDNGVIYFAASDQYAYALNASSGGLVWRSPEKLPGEKLQSWWPVVSGNYVVYSLAPAFKHNYDPGTKTLGASDIKEMYRMLFFGSTSGYSGDSITASGSEGWSAGSYLLDTESNNTGPPNTLSGFFNQYPDLRTYAVLNKNNGSQKDGNGKLITMPYIYNGTYSGHVYPPLVNPATGGFYARNLYSGSGSVGSISRVVFMGWKPNNRYLHKLANNVNWAIDEPQAFSGAENVAFQSLCCDRHTGYLGGTSWWSYPGILEAVLPYQGAPEAYDPMWRKYDSGLERLNSYYKGDNRRTNGVDSRNGIFNIHGLQNPPAPYQFINSNGQTVNRAFIHRSNTIIAIGESASKTYLPQIDINLTPANQAKILSTTEIRLKLEEEIDKMIDIYEADPSNGFLNPGYYNDGTIPNHTPTVYFENPADGLLVLAKAYNLINDANLKTRLANYLHAYYQKYFGSTPVAKIGWNNQPRENIDYPQILKNSAAAKGDTAGSVSIRAFYGFWKYAQAFHDRALTIYNTQQPRLPLPSGLDSNTLIQFPSKYNEYIAGYIGFLNLQQLAGRSTTDASLRNSVQSELNSLMSARVNQFDKDHPWYGVLDNPGGISIHRYTRQFNLSRNFMYLVKELGDYMRGHNYQTISNAIKEYVYLNPFWFSANVDVAFQEGVKHNLFDRPALFAAKAFVERASQEELSKYLDAPTFDRGDLYYIQNLEIALEAPLAGTPPPSPTPEPKPGDGNGDGRVDGLDYVIWANNYKLAVFGPANGDFNSNGFVDGFDYVIWANNYKK